MRTSGLSVPARGDRCLGAQAPAGESLAPLMKSNAIPHTCKWGGEEGRKDQGREVGDCPRAGLPR